MGIQNRGLIVRPISHYRSHISTQHNVSSLPVLLSVFLLPTVSLSEIFAVLFAFFSHSTATPKLSQLFLCSRHFGRFLFHFRFLPFCVLLFAILCAPCVSLAPLGNNHRLHLIQEWQRIKLISILE